jgi:hypothetical protein
VKPDKLTVHELFQRERRYVVPLYQRSYVWNEEDQWEPLWEDIEKQAEACSADESRVSRRSHFLGAIVLNVAKIVGDSVARSEIIDGQQRLTTLQVFIAALRDYANEIQSSHTVKLNRLTTNQDEKPDSDTAFKVWPTNADRVLFRQVMTSKSPTALLRALDIKSEKEAPRLAGAYLYFAKAIREYVTQGSSAEAHEERIFCLYQALRTALQIIVIELEENDDPQVIFETLNARGQPLLPSDLIRNFVFLQAANDPNLNEDQLYDKYWRPFDETRQREAIKGENRFWHVEERQGRLTRPRIDLFMFHYLVMKTERDLNIGRLFREFSDWFAEHPQPIEHFLADMKAHSDVFVALIAPTGEDRSSLFARRLKALDNSTVYPLLLYLFSMPRGRLSSVERDLIIEDLESWLVRRFVCALTNKNYNRFFVSLLSKLKSARPEDSLAALVRGELSRSTEVTLVWPDDKTFESSWLSKPIYVRSRPDRSEMILRALDAKLRKPKNEKLTVPEELTVEHLLPQKGSLKNYPFAKKMPLEKDETPQQCRERVIHTVGNLTLLTQELNSSVSNGSFPGKVTAIVDDSDLRINAWLRKGRVTTWSEESIIERGKTLFEKAKEIWREPPAPAGS